MIVIKSHRIRNILRFSLPLLLIPAVVLLGATVFEAKRYIFVSICVATLTILLFIAGFEKKEIGTRRMVLVAVMIALSVVGRFIPLFKPVTAITIISAMYLGGEAGFTVGAFSALMSNFYFGQGPWTPFQMLAWGLIGLAAGALAGPLKKSKIFLLIFGVVSGLAFSLIMDIWTVLWYSNGFDGELYLSAVLGALGHTALYAISNFLFLLLLAKPIGEKLGRIKLKYGV